MHAGDFQRRFLLLLFHSSKSWDGFTPNKLGFHFKTKQADNFVPVSSLLRSKAISALPPCICDRHRHRLFVLLIKRGTSQGFLHDS